MTDEVDFSAPFPTKNRASQDGTRGRDEGVSCRSPPVSKSPEMEDIMLGTTDGAKSDAPSQSNEPSGTIKLRAKFSGNSVAGPRAIFKAVILFLAEHSGAE